MASLAGIHSNIEPASRARQAVIALKESTGLLPQGGGTARHQRRGHHFPGPANPRRFAEAEHVTVDPMLRPLKSDTKPI